MSAREFDELTPEHVEQWRNVIAGVLKTENYDPMAVLASARLLLLLANICVLVIAFFVTSRAIGLLPALVGFALLALDPFHVAHSRLLHVDATGSNLVLLALILALAYATARNQPASWWMLPLCGIATGLALLTRSGSVLLIPWIGLALLIRVFYDRAQRERPFDLRELGRRLWPLAMWPLSAALVYGILWPAMWSQPEVMLERVYNGAVRYAQEGHALPIFFRGVAHNGDPGTLFYAFALVWRSSPATLIGVVVACIAVALRVYRRDIDRSTIVVTGLLLFALFFGAVMSTGEKKFDRYLLPAIGPLQLVAGWGWYSFIVWIGSIARFPGRLFQGGVGAIVLGSQAILLVVTMPYSLSYYDPLLGGGRRAPDVMPVGWGEGLDQVTDYLNELPNATEVSVYTDAWLAPFAMQFVGGSHVARFSNTAKGLKRWLSADYYVLYIAQEQQGLVPRELLDYFTKHPAVLDVDIDGIRYARVFDLNALPLPEYFHSGELIASDWGNSVRLVSAGVPADPVPAGNRVSVEFGVQPLVDSVAEGTEVSLTLVDPAGQAVADATASLIDATGQWMRNVRVRISIPESTPAGQYTLVAKVLYPNATSSTSAIDPKTGLALPEPVKLGEVDVIAVAPESDASPTP